MLRRTHEELIRAVARGDTGAVVSHLTRTNPDFYARGMEKTISNVEEVSDRAAAVTASLMLKLVEKRLLTAEEAVECLGP